MQQRTQKHVCVENDTQGRKKPSLLPPGGAACTAPKVFTGTHSTVENKWLV